MNFVFALMVCFIWAEISYSQMNKVTGWDTSKIKEEIAVLKENADELIKVTDNDNRSNSDGSCQNSLEVGLRLLRPQISALNKQMILLKEQLKKSLKTKTQTPGILNLTTFISLAISYQIMCVTFLSVGYFKEKIRFDVTLLLKYGDNPK